jgi:hypothetical protein
MGYTSETQQKNIAWYLPRPKRDHYKGGMPLYCEEWLIQLAKDILHKEDIYILNLFCGMNKYGFRVDIVESVKPDLVADAHNFADRMGEMKFDLIIADPPYSEKESNELYGTSKLSYKKWTAECNKVLKQGGLLVIYHKNVMPNPNPEQFVVEKRVFIGSRVNHLPRVAIYFRKK